MKVKRVGHLVATTATVGAVALLVVAPAQARFVDAGSGGGSAAGLAVPVGAERTIGLTGDSPLTRVSAPEPEGLTGDAARTRVRPSESVAPQAGSGDRDWTLIGVGSGGAALLLAAIAALLFANRGRERRLAMS